MDATLGSSQDVPASRGHFLVEPGVGEGATRMKRHSSAFSDGETMDPANANTLLQQSRMKGLWGKVRREPQILGGPQGLSSEKEMEVVGDPKS